MIGWFKNLTGSSGLELVSLYMLVAIGAYVVARIVAWRHDAKEMR